MKKLLSIIALSLLASSAVQAEKLKLKNEAPLFVSVESTSPRQLVVINYMGGTYTVPRDKQGLSSILSGVLNTGPSNMKEEEYKIAKFLDTSDIGISFSKKSSSIVVEAPPEKLESVLKLVKEIMLNPRFDKKTFEEKKRRSLTNRAAMDDDMQAVISYFASKYVFDYHPATLDGTGTVKTISSVTIDDLKKHMSVFFDPKRVFAASFGPMNGNDIKKLIDKTIFTDKAVKFEKFPYEDIDVKKYIPKSNKVVLINKPGSKDNQVLYIYPQKFQPATKSYLQYKLANYFVGGNSEALLFRILREERGLTYGAYSMLGRNSWGIWTFGSNDKVEKLIAGTNEIISGLEKQNYNQKDLDLTKLDLTTKYKENHELPSDTVMEEIGAFASSEDLNYYKNYLSNLESMKLSDVTKDIRSGFAQKPGYLIVMGDKKVLMKALKKNGYKDIKLLSISDIK